MSERVICSCDDWRENIDKIEKPIILQTLRSDGKYQFDGKRFIYCPWCGHGLTSIEGEA